MSFFDDIPSPPPPPRRSFRLPEWTSAPENMVGRCAALEPTLARSDAVAVALDGFAAYPSGVAFHVVVRSRAAGPLREAAAAAVELWPEDRPLCTRR